MIDFHTHILPNIDDGSRSIDETFNLIKEAKEAGFEGIVLTSHYIEKYYETNVPERDVWVNAISENLRNKGMDIDVYLGNEIYMSENIMQLLIDGKASTINNSCYVLFEMPLNVEPMNLYDVIYSLQEHKLIPILAHPERYTFVQKEPELITDLIEKGVLMQANYASILGYYGEKAQYIVRKFFEHNMIHFLGSDVHRQNTIYKMIPQAMEKIEEIVGANKLEELTKDDNLLVIDKEVYLYYRNTKFSKYEPIYTATMSNDYTFSILSSDSDLYNLFNFIITTNSYYNYRISGLNSLNFLTALYLSSQSLHLESSLVLTKVQLIFSVISDLIRFLTAILAKIDAFHPGDDECCYRAINLNEYFHPVANNWRSVK